MPLPTYHAIAAMSENRVIGNQDKIPWSGQLPEDFRWFKRATMGGTLIMGNKTFKSIGRPLPGRTTYVLTWDPQKKSLHGEIYGGEEALQNDIPSLPHPWWICGGSEIYERFLPRSQTLYLTVVKRRAEGDAFFPNFEDKFDLKRVIHENDLFRIEFWLSKTVGDPAAYPPLDWPFPS